MICGYLSVGLIFFHSLSTGPPVRLFWSRDAKLGFSEEILADSDRMTCHVAFSATWHHRSNPRTRRGASTGAAWPPGGGAVTGHLCVVVYYCEAGLPRRVIPIWGSGTRCVHVCVCVCVRGRVITKVRPYVRKRFGKWSKGISQRLTETLDFPILTHHVPIAHVPSLHSPL